MASTTGAGGADATVVPRPVLLARRLVRLLLALLLVRTAISLAQQDLLLGYYLPPTIDPDSSEGRTLVEASRGGSTSLTLIVVATSSLLLLPGATLLSRGARWVRTVTTVPCGVAALGLPLSFLFPGPWCTSSSRRPTRCCPSRCSRCSTRPSPRSSSVGAGATGGPDRADASARRLAWAVSASAAGAWNAPA